MDTCDISVVGPQAAQFHLPGTKDNNEQLLIKFQKILGTKIHDTEIQTHTSKRLLFTIKIFLVFNNE